MSFTEMFNEAEKAFDDFYEEEIVVETKGGHQQTVKALVGADNTIDPVSDEMLDTDQQLIQLTFKQSDWAFLGDIKRGDKIYRYALPSRQKQAYAVQDVVQDFVFGFVVKAREL